MGNKNDKSPAKRTYCVWADYVSRVYQEVEANSPQQAFRLAQRQPGHWQNCFEFEDSDSYHLSNQVQDVKTEECFVIGRVDYCCKTCGSEIVEFVNESNFKEGECGPCEYRRYMTSRELLDHLKGIVEMAKSVSANWENGNLDIAVRNLDRIATAAEVAITKAYGDAR
jgi:DNA-directed RNA polymerase subunit RPC12/RpoP